MRGKPFFCWISSSGKYRDVALHIGDEVEFRSEYEGVGHNIINSKWVRGKFGCHRKGIFPYFVRVGRKEYQVCLISNLRPVKSVE